LLLPDERSAILDFLDETDSIFAAWPHESRSLDQEVKELITARKIAKANKEWAEADKIREKIKDLGIVLEDRKDGSVSWHKI